MESKSDDDSVNTNKSVDCQISRLNRSFLRTCLVLKPSTGTCGFHLSRTTWDPYPWIMAIEAGSAAEKAGLQVGDCVIKINNEDLLGKKIGDIAIIVYSVEKEVQLLLWNAGVDSNLSIWLSGGNGPTPLGLQKLIDCIQSIIQLLECPICLETSPAPPVYQCSNGHLLCKKCRLNALRCPVCRAQMGQNWNRCLLADKLFYLLATKFLHGSSTQFLLDSISENKSKEDFVIKPSSSNETEEEKKVQFSLHMLSVKVNKSVVRYHCPKAGCDYKFLTTEQLFDHFRFSHQDPIVQYFTKTDTIKLHFPVRGLTVVNCLGMDFCVNVTPHNTKEHCYLIWLWIPGNIEMSKIYRYKFKFLEDNICESRPSGMVLPLTLTENNILSTPSLVNMCVTVKEVITTCNLIADLSISINNG